MSRIIQAFRDEDGRVEDAHRSGRPRATGEEEDMLIVASSVEEPFMSAPELRAELDLNVSCTTVRRRLREAGLKSCVAAQKPFLTESQRQQRLEFARSVENWTVEEWKEVIFTDESTFSTRTEQKRPVWRPPKSR